MNPGTSRAGGLREIRKARGLTRQRVADLAGCAFSTVGNIEDGWRCGPGLAQRIAAVLDCRPDDLWPGAVEPHELLAVLAGAQAIAAGAAGHGPMETPAAQLASSLAWSEDGTAVQIVPQGPPGEILRAAHEALAALTAERASRPGLKVAITTGEACGRREAALIVVAWTGDDDAPGFLGQLDPAHVLMFGGGE